jgi:hypothetical protein
MYCKLPTTGGEEVKIDWIARSKLRRASVTEDSGPHGAKSTDLYDLRLKAISSERGAFSDVHVRVTGGNLLRPAHGQLQYRRPIAGKGRSDIGYRSREASPGPRSSGNGVRREPAAHVM